MRGATMNSSTCPFRGVASYEGTAEYFDPNSWEATSGFGNTFLHLDTDGWPRFPERTRGQAAVVLNYHNPTHQAHRWSCPEAPTPWCVNERDPIAPRALGTFRHRWSLALPRKSLTLIFPWEDNCRRGSAFDDDAWYNADVVMYIDSLALRTFDALLADKVSCKSPPSIAPMTLHPDYHLQRFSTDPIFTIDAYMTSSRAISIASLVALALLTLSPVLSTCNFTPHTPLFAPFHALSAPFYPQTIPVVEEGSGRDMGHLVWASPIAEVCAWMVERVLLVMLAPLTTLEQVNGCSSTDLVGRKVQVATFVAPLGMIFPVSVAVAVILVLLVAFIRSSVAACGCCSCPALGNQVETIEQRGGREPQRPIEVGEGVDESTAIRFGVLYATGLGAAIGWVGLCVGFSAPFLLASNSMLGWVLLFGHGLSFVNPHSNAVGDLTPAVFAAQVLLLVYVLLVAVPRSARIVLRAHTSPCLFAFLPRRRFAELRQSTEEGHHSVSFVPLSARNHTHCCVCCSSSCSARWEASAVVHDLQLNRTQTTLLPER